MRLLVTGGAGFIGSHFLRSLLRDDPRWAGLAGADVTVLDKLTYSGNLANLDPVAPSVVRGQTCRDDPRAMVTRVVVTLRRGDRCPGALEPG
jgi:dTDP-D-glucose 4,6-dehydratase